MNNYVSVSEYARLYHKDPGNIRRHLASGRLDGEKIGNQWVIPKDATYPSDQRQKSGRYRGWRRRIALNSNKELIGAVRSLIDDLHDIYGRHMISVVLYGSYARGTQTEESDVDIAIMLDIIPDKDMMDEMIKCVAKYELECGKVLSVIDIQQSRFDTWKKAVPFYMNIDREGIVLWRTA